MHAITAGCPSMPSCALSADTESLFIAEIQQFLRGISVDAEVLRLAVCKLYPAELKMS